MFLGNLLQVNTSQGAWDFMSPTHLKVFFYHYYVYLLTILLCAAAAQAKFLLWDNKV